VSASARFVGDSCRVGSPLTISHTVDRLGRRSLIVSLSATRSRPKYAGPNGATNVRSSIGRETPTKQSERPRWPPGTSAGRSN
jgi:hypothetical protein